METIIPNNYQNFIGSITLLIAIICLFVTFIEKQRSHATKLFSIMLVVSISLFSAHWSTYFAAIFIVATAVTELEFLQNLAAIIRKDENYFNYQKETLSKEEHIRRKAEEVVEEDYVSNSSREETDNKSSKIDLSKLQNLSRTQAMRLSFDVEEKALDTLSKKYVVIERGVRFRKNGISVEYDGVISKKNKRNIIFEVKWTRNQDHIFPFIMHSIKRSKDLIERHETITGSKPEFNLIVITNTKTSINEDRLEKFIKRAEDEKISISFLSLSEIGFDVTHKIA